MSIWFTISAAPVVPALPSRDMVGALTEGLVRGHVVNLPAYLMSGTIGPASSPLSLSNAMYGYFRELWAAKRDGRLAPEPPTSIADTDFALDVRYLDGDLNSVLAAIYAAPVGAQDICVFFSGLAAPPGVDPPAHYTMAADVALFALRKRRSLYGAITTRVYDGALPDGGVFRDAGELRDGEVLGDGDSEDLRVEGDGHEVPAFMFLMLQDKGGPSAFLPHVPPVLSKHWGDDFVTLVESS